MHNYVLLTEFQIFKPENWNAQINNILNACNFGFDLVLIKRLKVRGRIGVEIDIGYLVTYPIASDCCIFGGVNVWGRRTRRSVKCHSGGSVRKTQGVAVMEMCVLDSGEMSKLDTIQIISWCNSLTFSFEIEDFDLSYKKTHNFC